MMKKIAPPQNKSDYEHYLANDDYYYDYDDFEAANAAVTVAKAKKEIVVVVDLILVTALWSYYH